MSNDFEIEFDGVITDVFLPEDIGVDKPEPRGIEVMIICKQMGIPFVVCTDMNGHHCSWVRSIADRLGAKAFIADKGLHNNSIAWESG